MEKMRTNRTGFAQRFKARRSCPRPPRNQPVLRRRPSATKHRIPPLPMATACPRHRLDLGDGEVDQPWARLLDLAQIWGEGGLVGAKSAYGNGGGGDGDGSGEGGHHG
ncbi:hypothetical protein NL676_013646 [Syzygium grande]|nr:hypothetical protein NL676_013646 [Syzygium grande]